MAAQDALEQGWDAALLEAWRDEAGHAGIHYIELLPGKPKVAIDLSGAVQLILQGRIGNELLIRGRELLSDEEPLFQAATGPEAAETAQQAFWAHHQEVMRWQDAVIASVWASPPNPPWCRMDDLPVGGRPPGQFCIHDIQPPHRRRMLVDLVIAGVDGLESFREQSARLDAGPNVPGVQPDAEQLPVTDSAAAAAIPIRRSDLARGADAGSGATGEPGSHLTLIPWEPDAAGAADSLGA